MDERILTDGEKSGPLQRTVNALLTWASELLAQSGVHEASLNTELLLAHTLGLERLRLKLDGQRELNPDEFLLFSSLIDRRMRREPLQYILGTADFMGLRFGVNPDVLIPRPETEVLVEKALELLRTSTVAAPEVLDIGTGSGNIALSIKHHFHSAQVTAMDISKRALSIAIGNSRTNTIEGVVFLEADVFGDFLPGKKFDMILSNPPYVSRDEFGSLDPEIRTYEPRIATTDGSDGFRFLRRLLETVPGHLLPGGSILVEIGYGQAAGAADYAKHYGLTRIRVYEDLSGVPRVLAATFPGKGGAA